MYLHFNLKPQILHLLLQLHADAVADAGFMRAMSCTISSAVAAPLLTKITVDVADHGVADGVLLRPSWSIIQPAGMRLRVLYSSGTL